MVGSMTLGAAYAGAVLVPTDVKVPIEKPALNKNLQGNGSEEGPGQSEGQNVTSAQGDLLAGAAKVSMEPRPAEYGGVWETEGCATAGGDAANAPTHVPDFRVKWPENPNCIYMGGYGIGPMNPITSWSDPYGLWVRSVAMQDQNGDVFVMTLIDAVYWEAKYNSMCGDIEGGCGWDDIKAWAAEEFGQPSANFMFASTHSHTSPDFIGGWGGVPQWYMQQMTDSIKASVTGAMNTLRPATLEYGETIVRDRNGERRDFYRSAEDDTFSWFRILDVNEGHPPDDCGLAEGDTTPCITGHQGRAIATVGAYAGHPVTADEGSGIANADFPAVFAKRVEENFGGIGAFFQTGLGNVSPRDYGPEEFTDTENMGNGVASYVPEIGAGRTESAPDIRVAEHRWNQPATNIPLSGLGAAGFFDRKFEQAPATLEVGKGGGATKVCRSASPLSVNTGVTAAKIGNLWITGGPGELFSNLTNTLEERNTHGVTLPLGLVNDGLGYIVQSFETDHVGRQGVGFAGGTPDDIGFPSQGLAEYEDAYSIDHCFGDAALEYTINLLNTL